MPEVVVRVRRGAGLADPPGHPADRVVLEQLVAGLQQAVVGVVHVVGDDAVDIQATARCSGQTGVEMEALTAASVAALTIYDMAKAIDRGMRITAVELVSKSGGRSGTWTRD